MAVYPISVMYTLSSGYLFSSVLWPSAYLSGSKGCASITSASSQTFSCRVGIMGEIPAILIRFAYDITLFFKTVRDRKPELEKVQRSQKNSTLLQVLRKDGIHTLFDAHMNLRRRVMMSLSYACGLPRSEVFHLKPLEEGSKRQESGTDLGYIQALLAHPSSETTEN